MMKKFISMQNSELMIVFYESVQNHSDFLIVNKRYSKLFEITNDENYLANWAKGLSECGYATDPTYANSLMSHIKNYGLK